MVFEAYVEKKKGLDVSAQAALHDIQNVLLISGVSAVRLINRYFVEGVDEDTFSKICTTVLSEPPLDVLTPTMPGVSGRVLAREFLPGQFDQRADSAAQCISFVTQDTPPLVRSAEIFIIEGNIKDDEFARIKAYLINPVESREAVYHLRGCGLSPARTPGGDRRLHRAFGQRAFIICRVLRSCHGCGRPQILYRLL